MTIFQLLLDRGMPVCVVHLLRNWYVDQKLSVRWNSKSSYSFNVSNGVRQGGVVSPILFTIYIDKLLLELRQQGVGCYWNYYFAGAYTLHLVSMSLHLLSISSESLRSEERILPRCTTVLEKPRGTPQKLILGSVDEPAA